MSENNDKPTRAEMDAFDKSVDEARARKKGQILMGGYDKQAQFGLNQVEETRALEAASNTRSASEDAIAQLDPAIRKAYLRELWAIDDVAGGDNGWDEDRVQVAKAALNHKYGLK